MRRHGEGMGDYAKRKKLKDYIVLDNTKLPMTEGDYLKVPMTEESDIEIMPSESIEVIDEYDEDLSILRAKKRKKLYKKEDELESEV